MRHVLVAVLFLATSAVAQEASESFIRIELAAVPEGQPPTTHVQVRNESGVLRAMEVPDPCTDPCVISLWLTLPDGDIWATATNEVGLSERSNVRNSADYLTLYQRADVNGDGRPSIRDLLLVNRMIFSDAP